MPDLAAVRQALATTIQNNVTIGGFNLPCSPILTGTVNPPCALIAPQPGQSIVFDTLDGGQQIPGSVTYHLRVIVLVSLGEDLSAQGYLDNLLSVDKPGSLISAIQDNSRLGGVVHYAIPTTAHGYGYREWAGQQYFGAELLVSVAA
jgi:hypothetical protein